MKLTIFAATGGVGRQLLEQAVAAGHDVTAVARNPGKLTRQVRTVTADLAAADPAALEPAVAGADAVLSGLGPHSNADAGIAAPGTHSIVAAMQAHRRRQRRAGRHRGLARPPAPAQARPGRRVLHAAPVQPDRSSEVRQGV
jgi:putative NADH-flavin reductase